MKKVVSVSLGSSRQDFEFKTRFLGQNFSVHRMGSDQDTGKAWELMRRQQATADAIGLGEISDHYHVCLLYTSPSPRDRTRSRMPSSA